MVEKSQCGGGVYEKRSGREAECEWARRVNGGVGEKRRRRVVEKSQCGGGVDEKLKSQSGGGGGKEHKGDRRNEKLNQAIGLWRRGNDRVVLVRLGWQRAAEARVAEERSEARAGGQSRGEARGQSRRTEQRSGQSRGEARGQKGESSTR